MFRISLKLEHCYLCTKLIVTVTYVQWYLNSHANIFCYRCEASSLDRYLENSIKHEEDWFMDDFKKLLMGLRNAK